MQKFRNEPLKNLIGPTTTLFWFRRDLRLEDNAGLYHALKENKEVLPLFIFDSVILENLEDKTDRRVEFIRHALVFLKSELEKSESSLLVLYGDPVKIFDASNPKSVYTNHDYEPYAIRRDEEVRKLLEEKHIIFKTYKDQVILEKDEVVKEDGKPYTIFTPYSRKWKSVLKDAHLKSYANSKYLNHLKKIESLPFPLLADIGFTGSHAPFPERTIRQSIIEKYDEQRNFPALEGTTQLSVHLRFGTIGIRKLVKIALKKNEQWLNELIWRDFYQMILWHFPQVETKAFKPAYDRIEWRNNLDEFQAWCDGRTGYPIVDAGMSELNATGFMHNRVRMIAASFLTKHLLIDWRWGQAYFAEKLLDFDLAANNGGWQWAAGSGCDAVPYFRIFNPYIQTEKFDPERKYIRKWVPEFESKNYQAPIVEHEEARVRALRAFKNALG